MNICLVVANFWPGWGGAERQCQLLARALMQRGHAVTVLTRGSPGLPAKECIGGVAVHRASVFGAGILRSLVWTLTATTWLRRRARQFSIVQCYQLLSPSHIGILARRQVAGQAVVARAAGGGSHGDVAEIRRLPLTAMRRRILESLDAFVTISREIEEELVAFGLGGVPFCRIPNAVDFEVFHPATADERRDLRARLRLPEDRLLCVFIGRFAPAKAPDLLLQAWALSGRTDAHLVLVGDGPMRQQVEAAIAAAPLSGRVTCVGSRPDVAAYLRAADLLVLPSRSEGMPNAILEAMACAVPVVATRVGAASEILRDGEAGMLVAPQDPEALAQGLAATLGDAGARRRLGERGLELAQPYRVDTVVAQYVSLYERLLSSKAASA